MEEYFKVIGEIIDMYGVEILKYDANGLTTETFDPWAYLLINDKYIWLLDNVYEVSIGCYYGGFEAYESIWAYQAWITNPSLLLNNFSHNFGFIYTILRDILFMIRLDKRTPIKSNLLLGKAMG